MGDSALSVAPTVAAMVASDPHAGAVVETLGYGSPGDGGGATYQIVEDVADPDGGAVIDLDGPLQAHLVPPETVSYAMFGAGLDDRADGPAIKRAHEYANTHGIPVTVRGGDFYVGETYEIPIRTDTDFGTATIHIDERTNTRRPRFHVLSDEEPYELPEETQTAVREAFEPGTSRIPALTPYRNSLLVLRDEDDPIGFRSGYDYHDGWAREDFVYIEEHGRILGDIAWSFNQFTEATVYPVPDDYLTITGGTFLLSGTNSGDDGQYKHPGFQIERSRTRIERQFVGLESGVRDVSTDPSRGFYHFQTVYDVHLSDVRLIPREKSRRDDDDVPPVPAGSYGIGGSRVLRATFRDVTAEGSPIHWGVFGTNLFKDFRVERCQLNRVDVHFHCHGLEIVDSDIGQRGITVTGMGDLLVENTTVTGSSLVSFRADYGGRWDGDIRIERSTLRVVDPDRDVAILRFRTREDEYGYDIVWGESIDLRDITIDYTGVSDGEGRATSIRFPTIEALPDRPVMLPARIDIDGIRVRSRVDGVVGFDLTAPRSAAVATDTRPTLRLADVALASFPGIDPGPETANVWIDGGNVWHPHIRIDDVEALQLAGTIGDGELLVRDATVDGLAVEDADALYFDHCQFATDTPADPDGYGYPPAAVVQFTSCRWAVPTVDGAPRPARVADVYNVFEPNEWIRYAHVGSQLDAALYDEGPTESFLALLAATMPPPDSADPIRAGDRD